MSSTPRHRSARAGRRWLARAWTRLASGERRLRRPSLLLRFGVLSAVLVAGLGLLLTAALTGTVESRALAQAEQTAARVARIAVQPQLHHADFVDGRIAPARLAALQQRLDGTGTDAEVLRVKVFDRRGTLLFSDEADLIGERHDVSGGLARALSGGIASEVETEGPGESETAFGTVLEVYVPVWMEVPASTGEQVVGAFEMYLPYGSIAAGVASDVRQLLWYLGLGLVALWAGLFQLVASASRRLRQHARTSQWLAQHDPLTGLPNRTLFTERTAQAVRDAGRTGGQVAVLSVDLDRFKQVNDALGHSVGDGLLRAVGQRLAERLGDRATVARLSGDEFAVLLTAVASTAAAVQVAEDVLVALRTPVLVGDVRLEIDAGVGVAVWSEPADGEDQLLQRADVALQQAKQQHTVVVYRPELDVHTPARLALFGQLRRAIDDGQLTLHYQPKVSLCDGRVSGVEALVRWQHPTHGLVGPADFVPLAEQTGLIRPLTVHVLRTALEDCRRWRQQGFDLTVAVNLSARSLLDADLPQTVEEVLLRCDVPAAALELEITETTAMADPARALAVLEALRALGVRLSVDDYGTGHASLSYLHQLPVDTLKIDKSFVQTMDSNPDEATIVRSTIDLARNLGLHIVAEGVETEAAWRQLSRLGCDAAQGYWLARPAPGAEMLDSIVLLEQRLRLTDTDRGAGAQTAAPADATCAGTPVTTPAA